MEPVFRMSMGKDPGEVARVNAAFAAFAVAHAVPAALQRSVCTVLDELLVNAVTYGRATGATVEAELKADRLLVTVSDDGRSFDPFAKPSPDTTLSIAVRPLGGLGIHLVKQMMDVVRYRREGDRNVVTLEKQLKKDGP